ncbi:MAG: 2-phosphosulfolactate phosphatase [Bacteroidetes bacterium]|nr:2-phosphosulfolactate phosphatase [Bacteroidota bacterium]
MPGSSSPRTIEVCFSPLLFPHIITREDFIIVLVDILRASTSICTAFANGVSEMIPIATIEEAREYKKKGYLVAAEREGCKLDFADMGNSAFHFMTPDVKGKTIVYSTTNGTQAIDSVKMSGKIVIGAFINRKALADWLTLQNKNVVILCAGWKNLFNLEDTLFAGALTDALLKTDRFLTHCDSAHAAMDLWNVAKGNILGYIEKAAHRHRLKRLGLDDVLEYSFSMDITQVIPVMEGIKLVEAGTL